jgi:hypothetical protein
MQIFNPSLPTLPAGKERIFDVVVVEELSVISKLCDDLFAVSP